MSFHPFQALEQAPLDPIMGLTEMFQKDTNPKKINLGIGVFLDEKGVSPVLRSVKQAERMLLEAETTKGYLGIAGRGEFGKFAEEMLFGRNSAVTGAGRVSTMHTPGGTGALRLGADFLAARFPEATIWVSDPTWANHLSVFSRAGLKVEKYPYLDMANQCLRLDEWLSALDRMADGDIVLLHGCCHNPSGLDPAPEQWHILAQAFSGKKLLPFFDIAYQGLGVGLEEDAYGVRTFAEAGLDMLVAGSFSKSFSLYRERVGYLSLVGSSAEETSRAISQAKTEARANYSNPPAHGGLILETVLGTPELRALWETELEAIRLRIRQMRELFVNTLAEMGVEQDFSFLNNQYGMFSFSGIKKEQVIRLREEYSIFMLENGRINVAGMTPSNMTYLCEAIATVLGK